MRAFDDRVDRILAETGAPSSPSHGDFLEERGLIRVQSMQGADCARKLRGLRG